MEMHCKEKAFEKEVELKIFKILNVCILLMSIPILSDAASGNLTYGSTLKQEQYEEIGKKKIDLPIAGEVTLLYFFNIANPSHRKIAEYLNFSYINYFEEKMKVQVIGVSKGDVKLFEKLKADYNIRYLLINDQDGRISSKFNFACGACTKIIIVDKSRKIRYAGSYNEQYIVDSVIRRYEKEK